MTLYHWQRFAGCKGLPREWFFDHERDQTKRIPEAARRACKECPVAPSCLEHALSYEIYGFWAGTTRGQRVKLRKQLGRQIQPIEGLALYHDGEYLLPSN